MPKPARAILHVDMDAFYASVEQHDHPELKGRPVLVGGHAGRGVVAAASYEARTFGVRSALPMRIALERCPQAIVLPPRMARYRSVSRTVFDVFREFTPLVEGLSLDEAYLDVTGSLGLFGSPIDIARRIKALVMERTGLTCSVGVAQNKLLAKIASELDKPDGLRAIDPEQINDVLDPLPVSVLPGMGPKTRQPLEAVSIRTLRELRLAADTVLVPIFGRHTRRVRERAAGIDDRPVVADWAEQQISAETTFERDIDAREALRHELAALADRVSERLRAKDLVGGCITLKVRRQDFITYTRSRSFHPPTHRTDAVVKTAHELLDEWLLEQPGARLRLLGIGLSHLVPATQLDLFAGAPRSLGERPAGTLDPALDEIRARFGRAALTRASHLAAPAEDALSSPRRGR